jgi:hypothetical protein
MRRILIPVRVGKLPAFLSCGRVHAHVSHSCSTDRPPGQLSVLVISPFSPHAHKFPGESNQLLISRRTTGHLLPRKRFSITGKRECTVIFNVPRLKGGQEMGSGSAALSRLGLGYTFWIEILNLRTRESCHLFLGISVCIIGRRLRRSGGAPWPMCATSFRSFGKQGSRKATVSESRL